MTVLSASNLDPEQVEAIDRLYNYDETLLVAGLGFGKAIVGLTALNDLIADGVLKRVLVLAPLKVATLTWGPEVEKWSHITVPVGIACGNPRQREAIMKSDARVVVTNFENLKWFLEKFKKDFDGLLIDEITKLSTPGATWVKALRHWVKKLRWRAGMSATPVAESGVKLYAQVLLLDCGRALGTRADKYRRAYFYPLDYNEYNWAIKPGAAQEIAERLRGLVFQADDAKYQAALPNVETSFVGVDMPGRARSVYREMKGAHCWGPVEAVNSAVVTGKLQSIAAGGLYAGEDRDLVWTDPFKSDALGDVLEAIDEPAIVCYHYQFERDVIRRMLPDAPMIGSGAKVSPDTIDRWNAGEIPRLLLHWKSGSHGLNLQGACRTLIHTSPLWSADGWRQTIGRIRRRGQDRDCRRIVLTSNDTVEEEMTNRLRDKAANEAAFMRALGEVQG